MYIQIYQLHRADYCLKHFKLVKVHAEVPGPALDQGDDRLHQHAHKQGQLSNFC